MKSVLMCYYLGAVAVGNLLVVAVNKYIQVPDAASIQLEEAIAKLPEDWKNDPRTIILPGYDKITGTDDDFIRRMKDGTPLSLEIPGEATFRQAALVIERLAAANGGKFPDEAAANKALAAFRDIWGGNLHYHQLNSSSVRLISSGPEMKMYSPWNTGVILDFSPPATQAEASWTDRFRPKESWLETRKRQLSVKDTVPAASIDLPGYSVTPFSGGQNRLEGAAYFRFFTWLILGTAVLFAPFALLYRQKTYLHE